MVLDGFIMVYGAGWFYNGVWCLDVINMCIGRGCFSSGYCLWMVVYLCMLLCVFTRDTVASILLNVCGSVSSTL